LNSPIKDLICEASLVVNKKIKLLLINTHGLSNLIETYKGTYSSEDVRKEDFEDLDPEAQIIITSCQTGSNIALRIAEVSNEIVCAPKKNLDPLNTFILRCPKHNCWEMRTYECDNNKETQHAVIFKGNKVSDPCINDEQEINAADRQFVYFKKYLINSEDMFSLGSLMEKKGNKQEAKNLYLQAAKLGNPDAMFNLGLLLKEEGNKREAENLYLQAANLGMHQAMYNLGIFLTEKGNIEGAKNWYLQAANLGNHQAMFNLAHLLKKEGNIQGAKNLYLQAANLGNPQAMNNLANLLKKEGNIQGAKNLYLQAANLGNPQAMKNLRHMLEKESKKQGIKRKRSKR
jgi:TPR repeat protein